MRLRTIVHGLLPAALTIGFAVGTAASSAAPALVPPTFLLPYAANAELIDYRPAINAAGTSIVFERQLVVGTQYSDTINLYIADLANPPPKRLVAAAGSTRPDWCWYPDRPSVDGPIAFSNGSGIYTVAPTAGSTPTLLPNTASFIYPYWFAGCQTLAVDATQALPLKNVPASGGSPETYAINATTGLFTGSLSGQSLWAGFPSVNRRFPGLLAFAGQQFSPTGYNQDNNYVYLADFSLKPPLVRPLDPRASTRIFQPQYQGRSPVWSPDGFWIAFESNRTCGGGATLAVFIEDGLGLRPATQVTDCVYNVQHPKWYRQRVNGRVLLVASALLHPDALANQSLLRAARGIASFDVTSFVTP